MAFQIADWFGYDVADRSPPALKARKDQHCPFIDSACTKTLHDGKVSGVCAALVGRGLPSPPVIVCPKRLYADIYSILGSVANQAFGPGHTVISPTNFVTTNHDPMKVVAFGHRYGKEIKLPGRAVGQRYSIDWILAKVGTDGKLAEFSALEVQAIDTTGNYRSQLADLEAGHLPTSRATAGLNWENVNKRILPQLIYKGHALRQEVLCPKGLFFVCPTTVYGRVIDRLGGNLRTYNPQYGSITFLHYTLGDPQHGMRPLQVAGSMTTTVDQVALAFTSPTNLPVAGAYQQAISAALGA